MDPTRAADYEDRGLQAVISVLLEIGQLLGAYRHRMVIVGGLVPWLLFPHAQPAHIGTLDIDLNLDPTALGDGEYKSLVETLEGAGYARGTQGLRPFQLQRLVNVDGGLPVPVIIDLLMPRHAAFVRNHPPLMVGFAVQKIDGGDVAMTSYIESEISGTMPDGRPNSVTLRVASAPALLVMKGYAINGRDKHKDAYDIYFSVQNYGGGPQALAQACRPLLEDPVALTAFRHIAAKFASVNAYGPTTVRNFLTGHQAQDGMTAEQLQNQAYYVVKEFLDALWAPLPLPG